MADSGRHEGRDAQGRFLPGQRPVGRAKGTPNHATVVSEIRDAVAEASPALLKRLFKIIGSEDIDPGHQIRAIQLLYDRALGKPAQVNVTLDVTAEEQEQALRELAESIRVAPPAPEDEP